MTRWNWTISPDTHPRAATEVEKVTVNEEPGRWTLFAAPWVELPPLGTAFTDTSGVLPMEQLLAILDVHGQQGTWWVAKMPPEANAGEPRYLTVTYRGGGEYELRHAPASERHPFILTTPARGAP